MGVKEIPNLYKEDWQCCGCNACVNVCNNNAIIMQFDKKGFRYPVIDSNKCVSCMQCEKVCPIKTMFRKAMKEN